jgi:hypothetical protein
VPPAVAVPGAAEDQLAAYLATFRLPEETVARVISLYERASADRDESEAKRRELTGRLERISKSYEWGDKPEDEYRAERAEIDRDLSALRATSSKAEILAQAAAFLRDLPAAWASALPEQRNTLARLVFESVEVTGDRLSAIVVKPDVAPLFVADGHQSTPADRPGCQPPNSSFGLSGSDGNRFRHCRYGTIAPYAPR